MYLVVYWAGCSALYLAVRLDDTWVAWRAEQMVDLTALRRAVLMAVQRAGLKADPMAVQRVGDWVVLLVVWTVDKKAAYWAV